MPAEKPQQYAPDQSKADAKYQKVGKSALVMWRFDRPTQLAQQPEQGGIVVGLPYPFVSQLLMGGGQPFFKCHGIDPCEISGVIRCFVGCIVLINREHDVGSRSRSFSVEKKNCPHRTLANPQQLRL